MLYFCFFLFFVGLLLAPLILLGIHHWDLKNLRQEIKSLKRKITFLEKQSNFNQLSNTQNTDTNNKTEDSSLFFLEQEKQDFPKAISSSLSEQNKQENSNPSSANKQQESTNQFRKIQSTFEQNIATKFPVWIGAISLIFASFFLVKYSIEAGWLKASVRITLGVILGGALIYAGREIIERAQISNYLRTGQALLGAGLASLYISLYATINIYGLLPPLPGFLAM